MRRWHMTDSEMLDSKRLNQQRELQEKLGQMPPADWVSDMLSHYQKTGTYRPSDLRRLLGDPTQGVEVGPKASLSSLFCSHSQFDR